MEGFFRAQWGWLTSGLALGLTFLLAVALMKPIGVSTQFVIFDGVMWNAADETLVIDDDTQKHGYASPNAYLNKSGGKYAKAVAEPMNYSFVFVLAMIAGGLLARLTSKPSPQPDDGFIPPIWHINQGSSTTKRMLATFVGGILVLFGARLAGGCTSGHMMSGMMQTSLSGYIFAIAAFAVAIPVAFLMYKRGA